MPSLDRLPAKHGTWALEGVAWGMPPRILKCDVLLLTFKWKRVFFLVSELVK